MSLSESQLRQYKRKRSDNPYMLAKWALDEVRGYHPTLTHEWLADLTTYSEKTTGEVEGFTVTASVEYDQDAELGEDDVTGRFVEKNEDGVCIPNTVSYYSYGQNGQGYGWYRPSNYDLEYAENEVRALGCSRGMVAELVRARLERAMQEDADRQFYMVRVTVYRQGIELAQAILGWIDYLPDSGDAYLQRCADELVPEAISEARETLRKLCLLS